MVRVPCCTGTRSDHGVSLVLTTFVVSELTVKSHTHIFSSNKFTNAGATGRTGPTLSACRNAYSTQQWAQDTSNNWLNMAIPGVQLWKCPASGTYTITIAGAAGARHAGTNNTQLVGVGFGRQFQTQVDLTQNTVYAIVVGQRGSPTTSGNEANGGGAGGGGSFFWNYGTGALIAAAGGGGGRAIENVVGANLLTETYGRNGDASTTATIFNYDASKSEYNSFYKATSGQSGGQWMSGTANGYMLTGGKGWTEMINANDFTGRDENSYGSYGGFGGGSATADHGGGGGGGYSGGGEVNYYLFPGLERSGGGGGSSYSTATMTDVTTNPNEHGFVTINPNFTVIFSNATGYNLTSYAPTTGGSVGVPYNDTCREIVTTSPATSYDNLPTVNYGGYSWLLQHNFGTQGRWGGLQLRNWSNGTISSTLNYSLPTSTAQIGTDCTIQNIGTYGIAGYTDNLSSGPNSVYSNYNSVFSAFGTLSNPTMSSSMAFYVPTWAKQVCLVVADYYRSDQGSGGHTRRNSYWWSANGSSWSLLGVASWRGSNQANGNIPENPSNDADMIIFNPPSAGGYILVLESGFTIFSVGFVLLNL